MTKEFKVGDKVFDIMRKEWGEVISTSWLADYPIKVNFFDGFWSYTKDGRYCNGGKVPQLFHYNPDEIVDWDGKEPLRVNHRAVWFDIKVVICHISKYNRHGYREACIEFENGDVNTVNFENLKSISVTKKIDHSSLAGSGVDIIYDDGSSGVIGVADDDMKSNVLSIRMNHWMLLTDERIDKILEGYEFECGVISDTSKHNLRPICVKGVKEGWEL